jgi:hypothetical protein
MTLRYRLKPTPLTWLLLLVVLAMVGTGLWSVWKQGRAAAAQAAEATADPSVVALRKRLGTNVETSMVTARGAGVDGAVCGYVRDAGATRPKPGRHDRMFVFVRGRLTLESDLDAAAFYALMDKECGPVSF